MLNKTPAIEPPKQQAPMEAIAANSANANAPGQIIAKQPSVEPLPKYENEIGLRGGGFNLGCTCCHGAFSFHKNCC
ncbi:hypothetical protein B0T17DRAFT_615058 [Bombardia bombarda]|uniref:Uncharacterized protein n=1 Tax=Bombardia bombarda TaxID=252184 RepID=A0AA39X8I4_9PEZI|nr:hypothetical protein B0T17DRAFT_615058 [Bombardia bombarda]